MGFLFASKENVIERFSELLACIVVDRTNCLTGVCCGRQNKLFNWIALW
jgi:hypothetical protein